MDCRSQYPKTSTAVANRFIYSDITVHTVVSINAVERSGTVPIAIVHQIAAFPGHCKRDLREAYFSFAEH